MSGMIAKSQIPVMSKSQLPPDARAAIGRLKNQLSEGTLPRGFRNRKANCQGPPLPKPSNGCGYVEYDVGQAHPGDAQSRGSHRLVVEVVMTDRQITASSRIREIYYTKEHYDKGTFYRIR